MKLRLASLFCMLVLPVLSVGASPTTIPPPQGGPLEPNPYPSQKNSLENPPRYLAPSGPDAAARLAYWNEQAWRTIVIDHTPPPAGPSAYAEQRARTRCSRAMAIVTIAEAAYSRRP